MIQAASGLASIANVYAERPENINLSESSYGVVLRSHFEKLYHFEKELEQINLFMDNLDKPNAKSPISSKETVEITPNLDRGSYLLLRKIRIMMRKKKN